MRFRKKPVVIEAVQFTGHNQFAVVAFCGGVSGRASIHPRDDAMLIATLEGDMRADVGDWIIKGVKGEFYPCKPDIFAATYEPA